MKRAFTVDGLEEYAATIREQMAATRAERINRYGWPDTVNCANCGDDGVVPDAPGYCKRCAIGRDLQREAERELAWRKAVPARVVDFRIATSPDKQAAEVVTEWLQRKPWATGENLILTGIPGSGKTGLAYGVLYEAHKSREVRSVYAVNVARWIDLLRPTTDPEEIHEQTQSMKRAERTSMLLLDDLGTEKSTDWTRERIYAIVNHRYEAQLPTIITSNLASPELRTTYGERLIDRLLENCTGYGMRSGNYRKGN